MPNAAWAWEFLRRNKQYRKDFTKAFRDSPSVEELVTGSRLIIGKRRYQKARDWGLLFFADPDFNALTTEVFWKPSAFQSTVHVELGDPMIETKHIHSNFGCVDESVILSKLCDHRVLFESINQSLHVVLNTRYYWFQLYCDTKHPNGDEAIIRFKVDGASHSLGRIKTIEQLLNIAHETGEEINQLASANRAKVLGESITALDIKRYGGTYKDIACALVGTKRTENEWENGHSALKEKARRALVRGRKYRDGEYLSLLE
ncbi:MAG: hypothetical protein COB36_14285 [Alphaproteobacteria bacterium]|nr:MAG: hypothetical protein COB36_14285 [Alphaproteobacteria bacterium]